MAKPRILLITNEAKFGDASGQINGYEILVNSEELGACIVESHKEGFDERSAFERVLQAVGRPDYDCVIIWTPGLFPTTITQFERILGKINGRPILYWEGDPWGLQFEKKAYTAQMGWWAANSEIVFSTASQPHVALFKSLGAKKVFFCPNTYCHLKFSHAESNPPPKFDSGNGTDFTLIASNTARIPGVSGLPGAFRRWELVSKLKFNSRYSTALYGSNWPKGWSDGLLQYDRQAQMIRNSKMSLNWDHFPKYHDYSSDRLPISLLAGRVHITTKHNGMKWAPAPEIGFFQEVSPTKIISRAEELLSLDPNLLWQIGKEGHLWAKKRLSHRESARYIISSFFNEVLSPKFEPWNQLPGPW